MNWKLLLISTAVLACGTALLAQEPDPCDHENPVQACTGRIVESRPALYPIKRTMHPLSWLEAGLNPVIRTFATGKLIPLGSSANSEPSFFKVDLDRMGPSSGYGPKFTVSHNLGEPDVQLEGMAQYTYRRYQTYQFKTTLPLTWVAPSGPVGRVSLTGLAAYRSRPNDAFFGLGNDTPADAQMHFRAITREAAVGLSTTLSPTTTATVGFDKRNIDVDLKHDLFTEQQAARSPAVAALVTDADLHSYVFTIRRDTKDNKEMPNRGGIQRAEISFNAGSGPGQQFGYWKYRLEAQQYFSLNKSGRSVIALRAGAETNQERPGRSVPFADLPIAGSWETLRGFADQRFYDKSVLNVGAEYRYGIWRAFDWAFFVDAAQVGPEPGDFGMNRFHPSYGVRLITRPTKNHAVSFDAARSKDGWWLYVIVHPTF